MRNRARIHAVVFILVSVAIGASATDFASNSLVIPIAGRTPGAFDSWWVTDVVVTNASRRVAAEVTITYQQSGAPPRSLVRTLNPRGTVILKDALNTAFGRDVGFGIVRIESTSPDAKITARARIYNIGSPAGEYGQIVPAMPLSKLARETYLPALSGIARNRTNIGVANPANADAAVFISLFDAEGELRGGFSVIVPANGVRQWNDVFAEFGVEPFGGATVQVSSSHGVYAYASIVRSDSGDGDFVIGTGVPAGE